MLGGNQISEVVRITPPGTGSLLIAGLPGKSKGEITGKKKTNTATTTKDCQTAM